MKMDLLTNIKDEIQDLKDKARAKRDPYRHVHCEICSKPHVLEYYEDYPQIYICGDCVKSFTTEYLLYRIQCAKNYIRRPEFDILEERLTFGSKCEPDPYDNDRIWIDEEN